MKVSEVLSFDAYDSDPRFQYKKPNPEGSVTQRRGDNIYYKDKRGIWRQRPSRFHQTPGAMERDLSVLNVLVARRFFYFGDDPVSVSPEYAVLVCRGRGHRCRFPEELVQEFVAWLSKSFAPGRIGQPSNLLPDAPTTIRKPFGSKRLSVRCCR